MKQKWIRWAILAVMAGVPLSECAAQGGMGMGMGSMMGGCPMMDMMGMGSGGTMGPASGYGASMGPGYWGYGNPPAYGSQAFPGSYGQGDVALPGDWDEALRKEVQEATAKVDKTSREMEELLAGENPDKEKILGKQAEISAIQSALERKVLQYQLDHRTPPAGATGYAPGYLGYPSWGIGYGGRGGGWMRRGAMWGNPSMYGGGYYGGGYPGVVPGYGGSAGGLDAQFSEQARKLADEIRKKNAELGQLLEEKTPDKDKVMATQRELTALQARFEEQALRYASERTPTPSGYLPYAGASYGWGGGGQWGGGYPGGMGYGSMPMPSPGAQPPQDAHVHPQGTPER